MITYESEKFTECYNRTDSAGILLWSDENGEVMYRCISNQEFYKSLKDYAIEAIKQQPFF